MRSLQFPNRLLFLSTMGMMMLYESNGFARAPFRNRRPVESRSKIPPDLWRMGPLWSSRSSSAIDSFIEKRSFESRLAEIERSAARTLAGFYEGHLNSFSVQPGKYNRLSITSTCFALQAILAGNGDAYDSLIQLDVKAADDDSHISARSILQALLSSDWNEEDIFQVPLLVTTMLRVDRERVLLGEDMDELAASRLRRMLEVILEARPQRRQGLIQTFSDYILFLCTQAYAELKEAAPVASPGFEERESGSGLRAKQAAEGGIAGLSPKAVPAGAASKLGLALTRCAEVSFNEICRQLALRQAGDSASFDVMRLAYSLLTYFTATNALSGTAGLEITPGQGPAKGTRTSALNTKLMRAALKAFFEEQLESGLWDKGQPIYKSFRKQGRNVGNAFVYSLDTLGSLMEAIPAESFEPFLPELLKTLVWIEQQQTVDVIVDYCDVESGQCYGKPLRGWASPHMAPDTSPLGWSTAQTLTCVSRMRKIVRELMHDAVLQEFRGIFYSSEGIVDTYWNRLLDSDLGPCGSDRCRTLKEVLEARIIAPFSSVDKGGAPSFGAAFSAILFGPPGTAKTTICESLARKLGWDFVVIDTSVFLADGLVNVASRIRYVFERLQVLDRAVILFDEIEEFCLDREMPGIAMESRMLTTAMLTAINDLRRAKRSVFFLATNRLSAFDSAIIRPGRFDMQLFVGTPNQAARRIQLEQQLTSVAANEVTKKTAVEAYSKFLAKVWEEDAMFMNYLEGIQFARSCASLVAAGEPLLDDVMQSLLDTQTAVMTVRGSTRKEFVASMGQSRL